MMRYLFISLGFITLTLGLLGIVTPGLPTTPFLLLTAYLFAKGSPRLHKKLMEHKITGYYINKINGGLSVKARLISIGIMWCMISFTAFVVFNYGTMRFVMLGLGVVGTIAQFIILGKNRNKKEDLEEIKTLVEPMEIKPMEQEQRA